MKTQWTKSDLQSSHKGFDKFLACDSYTDIYRFITRGTDDGAYLIHAVAIEPDYDEFLCVAISNEDIEKLATGQIPEKVLFLGANELLLIRSEKTSDIVSCRLIDKNSLSGAQIYEIDIEAYDFVANYEKDRLLKSAITAAAV